MFTPRRNFSPDAFFSEPCFRNRQWTFVNNPVQVQVNYKTNKHLGITLYVVLEWWTYKSSQNPTLFVVVWNELWVFWRGTQDRGRLLHQRCKLGFRVRLDSWPLTLNENPAIMTLLNDIYNIVIHQGPKSIRPQGGFFQWFYKGMVLTAFCSYD